jgi:23S rRNA (uracil1939-C5)-methyltransferase
MAGRATLAPGQVVPLAIEKAVAGGRMIARSDGQVVLVSGAIPGERITARIARVSRGVAYADTLSVDEPSPDRREPFTDPLCGGCLYAHIAYPRQLAIKGQVIADAFARIGRIRLPEEPRVAPSIEEGYRMRARLHIRSGQVAAAFFRESSHDPCDARATRQLLPATYDVLDRLSAGLRSLTRDAAFEIEVSENLEASERAVHVDVAPALPLRPFAVLARGEGLTGFSIGIAASSTCETSGDPYVRDVVSIGGQTITLRRHVLAFFQGNRYLFQTLMTHVVDPVQSGSRLVDLYAGVGVFSVAAAIARGAQVTAVEGDRTAAADLHENARTVGAGGGIVPVHQSVEAFTTQWRPDSGTVDVLIVDPSRTGMSHDAMEGAIRLGAPLITYVSCDVATLARDARKFIDAGYAIGNVTAFDLFPNTPHVETVVRFERG